MFGAPGSKEVTWGRERHIVFLQGEGFVPSTRTKSDEGSGDKPNFQFGEEPSDTAKIHDFPKHPATLPWSGIFRDPIPSDKDISG